MDRDELLRLDRAHVWHPYTPASAVRDGLPLIVRGEGPWLIDIDGARWFDAIASWWACALGHGHPRIVEAIRRQAGELEHSILGGLAHPSAARLAARLAARMPDARVHVHFASDGASAVEAAVKIALQYHVNRGQPERTALLSLQGGYHGDTLTAVGLGFLEEFHAPFRRLCPRVGRLPVPWGGRDMASCLAAARAALRRRRGRVAALIVEPLCQGAGGMRMYPAEFLAALFRLTRDEGCLLIADEIATGFGRTGRWFAFEHAGIAPDLVCVGKALSAGSMPISAAIVRDEMYELFSDPPAHRAFFHGHTFGGHPIAAAAALAAMEVYENDRLPERAATLGAELAARLAPLRELPHVADVRGLGMIAAVELADATAAARVRDELRRRRILVRPLGPVVYLMPPLNVEAEILFDVADQLAETVRRAR